jgi:hypothetical protein
VTKLLLAARSKDCRVFLPVALREGRAIWLDPVELAKAEHATARRARRVIVPTATAA